ncbi:hypothetical protein FDA94_02615 [Herbidospora galbida]|uniref:DUF7824 domain-containing protein n=1 Tax=Herbidospora galbida TaxID=2575442 RepID=A0A4V5V0H4_9ACTN|nr:DUF6493 family protein [Herbidospora galbida]TKK91683.1 hypothetical protein FDA94_02615 [Herbidospora galbida]
MTHRTEIPDGERWLAAFVAGAAADRAALRDELRPQVDADDGHWRSRESYVTPLHWQAALAAELVTPGSALTRPQIQPQRYWESASHSTKVRVVTRGEEPEPEPSSRRFVFVGGRPGRPAADDPPMRVFLVTWTSDGGPSWAVAREGEREIPYARGRIHLNGSPTDVERPPRPVTAWHDFDDDEPGQIGPAATGVVYDDSAEVMPEYLLDDVFERMAELGVDPVRIEAMRADGDVPPPGPDEPLVEVSVAFIPPRLRSVLPDELSGPDEWRRRNRLPRPGAVAPLHDFQLHRYAEVAEALRDDALPPVLLATPTRASGHLDPDVLVDRLETCAAAGVEPLPADLAQALLRLPRGGHHAAAERAAKIDSAAAAEAARRLAGGGMADPECGFTWQHLVGASVVDFGDDELNEFLELRLRPVLQVTAPTGLRLIDEVLLRRPDGWTVDESAGLLRDWPAMLPSHREVVAVNFLPYLLREQVTSEELAGLELAEGPIGEPTAVIIAFLVACGAPGVVPLVRSMAAKGDLPVEQISRQLVLVLRRSGRETRPAVAVLSELAEAGGHHEAWRIVSAVLPALLPSERHLMTVTLTELVAFAADVACRAGARGEIPIVAENARSPRTLRFVRECRRLHAQLTGATP